MNEIEFLLDFDKQVNNNANNNNNNNNSNSNGDYNLLSTVTPFDHSLNLDLSLGFNISSQNNINNGFGGNLNDSRYGFLSNGSKERYLGLGFCNENGNIGSSNGLGFYNENNDSNGYSNDYRYGIMLNDARERNLGLGFCNETQNIDGTSERVLDLRFCNENRKNNCFGDDLDDYRYGIVSNGQIKTRIGLGFGNLNNISIGPNEDMFMSDDVMNYFAGSRENENNGGNGELYNGIRNGVLGLGLEIFDENRNVGDFEDNMDMVVGEYGRKESALTGRVGNGSDEEIEGVVDNGLNVLDGENGRSGVQIGSQRHDLDEFDNHMDDSCCAFMSGDPDGRVGRVLGEGYSNENRHLGDNMDDFEIMLANGRESSNVSRNFDDVEDDMADSVYGIMMTDSWESPVSADEEIQDEFGIVNQDENRNSSNVQARFVVANERGVSGMLFDNVSFAAVLEEFDTLWNPEDEYEMLVGQIENEVPNKPTSKTVVENLQMVTVTKCDVDNDKATCAICKDDMGIGEKATLLPCLHRYHGGCIDEWLGIRNTCPVCRYEFPTDDDE